MRWVNDYRIKKYFALIPYEIKGEYRWLETVYVRQRYDTGLILFPWVDVRFVERADYERYLKEKKK